MNDRNGSVARATAWSASGALGRMALNFVGMIILARLVAPQAFGVFAVASSLVLLVAYLSEIGSSWALIQRDQIRPDHVGSALTLALVTATVASSVLGLSAVALAEFMDMPDLKLAILVMCLIIPVQSASGIPRALLRRHMRFGRLASVDLVAAVVGLVCGVAHALATPSYLSLLVQAVTFQIALGLGLWTKQARRAVSRPTFQGCRELFRYAGGQTFYEALLLFSKSLDTFLIARLLGAVPLGLYSRAFALMFTPLGQVYAALGAVAFSAMSRRQAEPDRLRSLHQKFYVGCLVGIALPLTMFSAFTAEFVLLVLGEEWSRSASVLRVLAVAAAFQVIYANLVWVLQATAQMRTQIRAGTVLTVVNVLGFVGAAFTRELNHFAIAYIGGTTVAIVVVLSSMNRPERLSLRCYLGGMCVVLLGIPIGQAMHLVFMRLFSSSSYVIGAFCLVLVVAALAGVFKLRRPIELAVRRTRSARRSIC